MKIKKLSALVLVLIIATAVFAGCSGDLFGCSSGTAITLATGEKANWFNQNHYEKVSYDIVRYAYGEKNADDKYELIEVAAGTETMTLEGMKSTSDLPAEFDANALGLSGTTKYNYSVLTMESTLTYNEKSDGLNKKTDTMTSKLLFYTSDLLPIYLTRSENYESNGDAIQITTNYIGQTNKMTLNGEDFYTEVKSGVYDNDLMFYVMRAKSSLAAGSSDSIEIFSPKDSVAEGKGKAVTKSMTFTSSTTFTDAEDSYLTVDKDSKFVPNVYSPEELAAKKTKDGYKLPRLATGLYINATNRGPIIQLNYSLDDFVMLGQRMSKVLMSVMTTEYDYEAPSATAIPAFSTVYTISDYTILKQV